jgi:hypothetical protein
LEKNATSARDSKRSADRTLNGSVEDEPAEGRPNKRSRRESVSQDPTSLLEEVKVCYLTRMHTLDSANRAAVSTTGVRTRGCCCKGC